MTAELQLKDIDEADIDDNDILLGRGGKTNHHPGNASYLKQIEARQVEYMFLESRTEKTEYAMNFVQQLRKEGIRFLKKDDKDGKKWSDVGDTKMREKVSQNLREHQPKLKKQLAEQQQTACRAQIPMSMQLPMSPMSSLSSMPSMPTPLQPTTSTFCLASQNSQQQLPPLNVSIGGLTPVHSPMQQQRQFVDHQALFQQQQFFQMQAQAQQYQQLLHHQQQQINNTQFPGYPNSMMPQHQQQQQQQQLMARNSLGSINLPFNNNSSNGIVNPSQWNNGSNDERERNLLGMVGANQHQMQLQMSSFSAMPEAVPSNHQQLTNDDDDNHHEEDNDNGDMPLRHIQRPSITKRIATLTDIDVAVAMQGDMGESTHSILEMLDVDPVPEEDFDADDFAGDSGDDDPYSSPKPNYPLLGRDEQLTPVLANKSKLNPFADPVTVTPTPSSPRQKKVPNTCFLDNDMLAAWASTADDDDAFQTAIATKIPTTAEPSFRRSNTSPKPSPSPNASAPFRRSNTNPKSYAENSHHDPFRSTSPQPPRKLHSESPRPSALTMTKRATSNLNETPETRGHLTFQEPPLGDDMNPSFHTNPSSSHSSSSWGGSVKKVMKASLGRDKSAQSRLLKQQCMPHAYGASGSLTSSTGSFNAWPTNLNLNNDDNNNNHGAANSPCPTSPMPNGSNTNHGTTNNVTPKTQRVLQDFGKMTLTHSAGIGTSPPRTADKFEDTAANQADKLAMDLMVKKPSPLQWRNRTTTIEALDLDSLEDDTVLAQEFGGDGKSECGSRRPSRSSFSSIAGMWANMPTSEEFENLVSDIAGQEVTDLGMDQQQSRSQQNKTPPNLALPNLKT